MTLPEFLKSNLRNSHVTRRGFVSLYVRKSVRMHDWECVVCFDIASVEVRTPFKGTFKKLIAWLLENQERAIFVESVLDPHFGLSLERMGFVKIGDDRPQDFILLRGKMENDETTH